ncbi:MAG: ATP synthase gamma chain [Myxococcota bacterium]|nr:ATP synthase gamma chain [Myxococcota bacterium]
MANLRTIRRRIGSVRNTQQITRAMKMVAASKLRRAQTAIEQARPYSDALRNALAQLAARSSPDAHPLLRRPEKTSAVTMLLLTSDRGLCGSFNSNIIRRQDTLRKQHQLEGKTVSEFCLGRKGADYFRKRGDLIDSATGVFDSPSFAFAQTVANKLAERFTSGQADEVWLLYNRFRSAISQETTCIRLLPITPGEAGGGVDVDFIYEPNRDEVLAYALPKYLQTVIFTAILDSAASEHGARMTAMDGATRNSAEMIRKLRLEYNRARQAAITKELLEIIGGAEALKG